MKSEIEHTSTTLGSQNMKSSQRMVSVVEPYELPEGWKWCRLGDCSSLISKGTTPKGGKEAYIKEGINFLRIENLNEDGSINHSNISHISKEEHEGSLKRSILEAGDLLISIAGTLGKVGFVRECDLPMNTNQAIAFVRLHKNLFENMYLKYAIESPLVNNKLLSKTKVTSIPNLTLEIISNCKIPLPSTLAEQQRIVNRIESMFAKLDEAKEKAQNVLDGFETRKAAILRKAFTGELTAKWRKENGVCDDSWEVKTIGECLIAISDKYDPQKDKIDGVQYIGLENIEVNGGIISTGDVSSVKSIKTLFKNNDLLYGKLRPYLNKHDIVEFDGICSTDILVYRSKPEYEIKFFNYLFSQNCFIQYAIENSNGINLPRTSEKNISAYSQKIPTLPEQVEIVRILDIIIEKENKAKQAAEALLEQIDLLKKSILAQAFRGEL